MGHPNWTSLSDAIIRFYKMATTINIVNEDVAVARIMAALLNAHGFSDKVFHSADEFLMAVNSQTPSISFVSFGLSNNGARVILDAFRQRRIRSTIVMTSDGVDTWKIVEAIKSGAEDVVEKPFCCEDLLTVIRRILSAPMQCAASHLSLPNRIAKQLTSEEQKILSMMEQGMTIKQIASRLDISIRTVHYRKASILEKTDSKSTAEVISKISAIRTSGLVTAPQFPQYNANAFGQTA
jgi:FixJ family two-component response regulator